MTDKKPELTRRRWMQGVGAAFLASQLPRDGWAQEPKAEPKGKLVLVGGSMGVREEPAIKGEDEAVVEGDKEDDVDPNRIMRRIRKEMGGFEGKTIVVCTCAAGEEDPTAPARNASAYKFELGVLGDQKVNVVTVSNAEQANDDEIMEHVKNASMVFFGGGSQRKLMKDVAGSKLHKAVKERFDNDPDFILAGTSAGAAVMSKTMIFKNNYEMPGLGFTDWTIDTHVNELHINDDPTQPHRQTRRLMEALRRGHTMGLGIDGSSAVMIADGKVSAFGRRVRRTQFVVGEPDKMKTSVLNVGETVPLEKLLKTQTMNLVMP